MLSTPNILTSIYTLVYNEGMDTISDLLRMKVRTSKHLPPNTIVIMDEDAITRAYLEERDPKKAIERANRHFWIIRNVHV